MCKRLSVRRDDKSETGELEKKSKYREQQVV